MRFCTLTKFFLRQSAFFNFLGDLGNQFHLDAGPQWDLRHAVLTPEPHTRALLQVLAKSALHHWTACHGIRYGPRPSCASLAWLNEPIPSTGTSS